MLKINLLSSLVFLCAGSMSAQVYDYRCESFEDAAFDTKAASVTSSTGLWTTNKNARTTDQAHDGSYSLLIAQKAGIVLPELPDGAGSLIYYAYDQNRQVNVEVSSDNVNWELVETYKETTPWTKHNVPINRADVKWVRISTTSNNQFYIDDILVTKLDGTDGDGNQIVSNLMLPYFINDFEHSSYPQNSDDAATEKKFNISGQGEWLYLKAYKGTNESYIPDGSGRSLRMLKNGSYVVTPVLEQGVVKVMFDEGRGGRKLSVYTSTDAGASWTLLREVTSDTKNTLAVDDRAVNRIKIANESGSDADIDNLTVTAFPEGTPASVSTGDASAVGHSFASVSGSIDSEGSKTIISSGFCWAIGSEPTVDSNCVEASGSSLSAKLTGLPAESAINYRAYALSLAGVGYGEVKTFTTLPPTAPVVETISVSPDDFADEINVYMLVKGSVSDFGGVDVTEVGACYSTSPSPTISSDKMKGYLNGSDFAVALPLAPISKYYIRTYAINKVGTSYGDEIEVTTDEIVIPDYEHNVYYCDPAADDSTADGSEAKPFYSLQKAVDIAKAGDIIYMNAGTYNYSARINIPTVGQPNSGMIKIEAVGGRAVLDFAEQPFGDNCQGIRLTGSYWHIYGLDIVNAGDNGLLIERNKPSGGAYADIAALTDQAHDNVIENCNFIRCQDTGLQMKNLASYNRIINCDAYYNCDPDHGDADGFAVKISHGTGNYFYGCRAWQNSDDGWDQFIKKDGGFPDDITTTLDNCWAFENGFLEDGSQSKGNGNGFKMGSDQGRNNVIMNRCLTFDNLNKGFDQNHNTGHMILNNCTAYSTKDTSGKSRFSYRLDEPVAADHEIRLTNCVAISDGISDRNKSDYAPHSVVGTLITSDLNTLPSDYISVDPEGLKAERKPDGSLPDFDFMHIKPGNTKLIDAGSEVIPFDGQNRYSTGVSFNGAAPDLGCFETSESGNSGLITISANSDLRLHAVATMSGALIVTVDGADALSEFRASVFDLSGRTLDAIDFTGHTVTLTPSAAPGSVLIVRITGPDFTASLKIRL